jgi:hypothetical protein
MKAKFTQRSSWGFITLILVLTACGSGENVKTLTCGIQDAFDHSPQLGFMFQYNEETDTSTCGIIDVDSGEVIATGAGDKTCGANEGDFGIVGYEESRNAVFVDSNGISDPQDFDQCERE